MHLKPLNKDYVQRVVEAINSFLNKDSWFDLSKITLKKIYITGFRIVGAFINKYENLLIFDFGNAENIALNMLIRRNQAKA